MDDMTIVIHGFEYTFAKGGNHSPDEISKHIGQLMNCKPQLQGTAGNPKKEVSPLKRIDTLEAQMQDVLNILSAVDYEDD